MLFSSRAERGEFWNIGEQASEKAFELATNISRAEVDPQSQLLLVTEFEAQ